MQNISVFQQDRTAVIKIGERFDFSQHKGFRQAYESRLQTGDTEDFVIDLGSTRYLDSSALGMLLVLKDRLQGGRSISLVNCSQDVLNILKIANFDQLFTIG